jgi:hypothetical protein
MLRDSRLRIERLVRWQNRFEETDDEAQPKGENDPRNHHPPITGTCEYCQVSQFFRRSGQRLHRSRVVQETGKPYEASSVRWKDSNVSFVLSP